MAITDERPIGFGRMKRKEDPRFVRGQGNYVDDVNLPGMLHGAALRSPLAHARIVSIDTSAALQHPKVRAVITGKDLEAQGLAWMPTLSADTQAVLATDKVRFQGQEVAFVVADDHYAARDALELIDVEYEPLPVVARRAPRARPRRAGDPRRQGGPDLQPHLRLGGRQRGRDRRASSTTPTCVVVTQEIPFQRVHPAPLETCGAVADYDSVTGKLRLWCTTQAPHAHRTLYAIVAGLPEHKIQVIAPDIGGGFGNKVPIYPGYVCAVVASIVSGHPVKWMEDRTENLTSTGFARDYLMRGKIAADRDGRIRALRVDVLADHGAFNATAQPTKYPAGFFHIFTGSYDLEAAYCTVKGVYTNKAPGGVAYRCSFRVTEAAYLVERMVDLLADELGMDPVELRLKNFIRPDQFPYTTQDRLGVRLRRLPRDDARGDADRRLRRAARASRPRSASAASTWASACRSSPRRVGAGPRQGHGHRRARHGRRRRAARAPDRQGDRCGSRSRRRARATRRRSRRSSPRSSGSRRRTSRSCTATPTRRRSAWAPTARARRRCPARRPRWSRARCASKARQIAAAALEVSPDDLEWEKGRWFVKGDPEKGQTIQELALASHGALELPEGVEGHLDAVAVYDPPNLTYPYGAYICVVDVDTGTGEVKLRRFIAVDDCGVRINPMIVEGQIHGGLAEGIGIAMMQKIAFDEQGNCLSGSFMDYLVPSSMEVPELGARRDRHAVAAPSVRGEGRRRVGERRLAAGGRQRGRRRARAVRRAPHRHAADAVEGLAGGAGLSAQRRAADRGRRRVRRGDRRPLRGADQRPPGRPRDRARRRHDRGLRRRLVRGRDGAAAGAARAGDRRADAAADPARRAATAPATEDGAVVVANPCLSGGALELFLEPHLPPPRVAIAGESPVARALAGCASRSGCGAARRGRPSRATSPPSSRRSGTATRTRCGAGSTPAASTSGWSPRACAARRCSTRCARRASTRTPSRACARPPGVDIGARTHAEIALSILAEIVAVARADLPAASRRRRDRVRRSTPCAA